MTPSTSQVQVDKDVVEYREPSSLGSLCVKVMLTTATPRVMVWMEERSTSKGGLPKKSPASMFIDELNTFVEDAKQRLQ